MIKNKKKIGFVIGKLSSGGAERVISTLSNNLIEKFDITIITFYKSQPFYNLDQRISVVHCEEFPKKSLSTIQSIRLNYILLKKISKILKTAHIDIAVGFITSANILTVLASKLNKIPSIICERNNPLMEDVPKFWVILRRLVYPRADTIVLQTQGIKKIYKGKIRSNKIVVLPNPISAELSQLRGSNIKREKLILSVGRLDKNKDHEILIKAFSSIHPKDWRVIIIGDGNKKKQLTKLIEDLNLSNKIKIISKVKDIHEYYNKSSIFAFTSKTEGFPNALLEAMHFGLPSISSNCDFGPSDLIENGINGFLIPVSDQEELINKLTLLIEDKNLRNKFSENAKETTKKYTSENVIIFWESMINRILIK